MKQRISTRPAFNEFSNKRKWSKTSAQVNERLLELSLVQGTFPDYNSTISCFSIDDPTFLCDLLARSTEGDSSVMSVNSLFYFSERSFKLKKSVHFPDELQLLLTETANSTHMHRVFMDGELVDSNKECGIFYGTLKGITASGSLHLRPLCSRSDLELAVFEMLEPSLFSSAVVYRPKSSDKLLVRDESTSFRFIYHLTSPHVWQTIRCACTR
jgi:hypothetical protein